MSLPITLENIAATETAMGLTFPATFKAQYVSCKRWLGAARS